MKQLLNEFSPMLLPESFIVSEIFEWRNLKNNFFLNRRSQKRDSGVEKLNKYKDSLSSISDFNSSYDEIKANLISFIAVTTNSINQ